LVPSTQTAFRGFTIALAVILVVCGAWILDAEWFRPGIQNLPVDARSAYLAANKRENASLAASIGYWRGDLWAESAYTYASLLFPTPPNEQITQSLDQARHSVEMALSEAPHNAGVWLLLAGLSSHFNWTTPSATAALKMSYYTGPSDIALIPLRLSVAAHANALSDIEIQQFVQRDLHIIFSQKPDLKPAIIAAYRGASSEGQNDLARMVADIDPDFAQQLHPQISN
jgi:hypothetical protein